MEFFAYVKPRSMLERRWKAIALQAGPFLGINFFKNPMTERYESGPLTPLQISAVNQARTNFLVLEGFGAIPTTPSLPKESSLSA